MACTRSIYSSLRNYRFHNLPIPTINAKIYLLLVAIGILPVAGTRARSDMGIFEPKWSQATRIYRRRLGDFEITSLSDGFVDLSFNAWQNIDRESFDAALDQRRLFTGGFRNGITSHLVNTGEKLWLVDSGAAGLFGPNSHHFPANLSQSGVAPADIDAVLITHAHPDHVGGLLSNGRPTLPNARLYINEIEYDFWTSADTQAKAPEYMRGWFDLVRAIMTAYEGQVSKYRGNAAIAEGISAIHMPGHTPGHSGYLIESASDRLLIWGDLAVSTAVQFPNPKASMIFDIDADVGHASRIKGFDMAVAERLLVAGTHLPFPTYGYVVPRDGAYEWVPEEWRHDLANTPWMPVV